MKQKHRSKDGILFDHSDEIEQEDVACTRDTDTRDTGTKDTVTRVTDPARNTLLSFGQLTLPVDPSWPLEDYGGNTAEESFLNPSDLRSTLCQCTEESTGSFMQPLFAREYGDGCQVSTTFKQQELALEWSELTTNLEMIGMPTSASATKDFQPSWLSNEYVYSLGGSWVI